MWSETQGSASIYPNTVQSYYAAYTQKELNVVSVFETLCENNHTGFKSTV